MKQGDYIVRADQPYRTLADMYFSLQNYSPANPAPYDDTGWTFPLMRNVKIVTVADKSIQKVPCSLLLFRRRIIEGINENVCINGAHAAHPA